jgi:dolichyl-phosphate beta-glucosyltransferase
MKGTAFPSQGPSFRAAWRHRSASARRATVALLQADLGVDRPALSVVLPAHDEAARIATSVEKALAYLSCRDYPSELLVVSDGSTDATARIAREAGGARVRVIENPTNRGKGHAVRAGMLEATGSHILFSDVDFATPIDEVERFRAALAAGCDLVVGSRALPDSDVRVRQAWWRQSMGRTFNRIVRAAVGFEMRDTQCGFKCFRRDAARAIFSRARIDRYAFDVEVLWIAQRLSLRVGELPVIWADDPHSKVHPIRDSLRMLVDLAAIRRNDADGAYGEGP